MKGRLGNNFGKAPCSAPPLPKERKGDASSFGRAADGTPATAQSQAHACTDAAKSVQPFLCHATNPLHCTVLVFDEEAELVSVGQEGG